MEVRILNSREISKMSVYLSEKISPENYFIIGCFDDYEPMGVTVISVLDGFSIIDWMYVGQNYRRRGAAKQMVDYVKKWADEQGISIVCRYEINNILNHTFIQAGFDLNIELIPYYEIELSKLIKKIGSNSINMDNLGDYRCVSLKYANDRLISNMLDDVNNGDEKSIGVNEYELAGSDQSLSQVLVKNNSIIGLLLVKIKDCTCANITILWCNDKKPQAVLYLILGSVKNVIKSNSNIDKISFCAVENSVKNLAEKLFNSEPKGSTTVVEAVYLGADV